MALRRALVREMPANDRQMGIWRTDWADGSVLTLTAPEGRGVLADQRPCDDHLSKIRGAPASEAAVAVSRCRGVAGQPGPPGQDTGMRFSGSTNGMGTTVAARLPHSVSTRRDVPSALSSIGTQQ